jgi:hypothetical protein
MPKGKPRNFFARKKEIVAEKKKLANLNKERRILEKDLKNILDMYKMPPDLLQRMPASSFYNLLTSPKEDEGSDDQVKLFDFRDKIRKEHKQKITRLEELLSEIKIVKIELALAKIRCMENELEK